LQIIKETNQFIAVNKPSGLIVERNPFEPSVEDWVWEHLQKKQKKPYLGVIHRLDRVTSGVLLLAKKKGFLKNVNEQFRLRKIRKTYLAIVENKPPNKADTLIHFLEKKQKEKKALIFKKTQKGAQEVQLHYRILEEKEGQFLLEIHPKTGKFHQIRAQLAAIGCPIIGDEKYGGTAIGDGKKIALHAEKLTFLLPNSTDKLTLKAVSPNELFSIHKV